MANRTTNRQPFSVPVRQTRDGFFNHLTFKGLCDNKNDITVDQETFADVNNMYVDDSNVLVSRPAFKFSDDDAYIIEQWMFGNIGLRLYRTQETGNFIFTLECFTHDTINNPEQGMFDKMQWTVSIEDVGYDYVPEVKHIQIEDKIFTWFAGINFVCLNTTGIYLEESDEILYYFEDAIKYVYVPIHKQVINGIETELESKNFLTDSFKKRHIYSSISSINFEKLIGRHMTVNLNSAQTNNKSKHLYDIIVQKNQDKVLIYPHSAIGTNYHIDIVQTPRATVFMRYSKVLHTIEISFDGITFRPLPDIDNIIGNPQLTKDGMWVVAFTSKGLAKCRLVAQESLDFVDVERVFSWTVEPYLRRVVIDGVPKRLYELDASFIPVGYFETIEQFAYIFRAPSIYDDEPIPIYDPDKLTQYIYAEWLSGANDTMWGHYALNKDMEYAYTDSDLKIFFKYVAPTMAYPDISSVVSIVAPTLKYIGTGSQEDYEENIFNVFFKPSEETINNMNLVNDDIIKIVDDFGVVRFSGYIHKLTPDAKALDTTDNKIYSGDVVAVTPESMNDTYNIMYWAPPGTFNEYHTTLPLSMWYLCFIIGHEIVSPSPVYNSKVRFVIQKADGSTGEIKAGDKITLRGWGNKVEYSVQDMENYFGPFPKDPTDPNNTTWADVSPLEWSLPSSGIIYNGNLAKDGVDDITEVSKTLIIPIDNSTITHDSLGFSIPLNQIDTNMNVSKISATEIIYDFTAVFNTKMQNKNNPEEIVFWDRMLNIKYNFLNDTYTQNVKFITDRQSQRFKLLQNANIYLTDLYLYIDGEITNIPQNGELSLQIEDEERIIDNNDNLLLSFSGNTYDGNIHRLTNDGISLSSAQIKSGDMVSYTKNASSEIDYLKPGSIEIIGWPRGSKSNRYIIKKLDMNGNEILDSVIKIGDFVVLEAYHDNIWLPVGSPGNPFGAAMEVYPRQYPPAPDGWTVGDPWPTTDGWEDYHPTPSIIDGKIVPWRSTGDPETSDPLPTGPVKLYGVVSLSKRVIPLSLDVNSIWYNIDGTLWTSKLNTQNVLELDEYINAERQEDGTHLIDFTDEVPDYNVTLNEHFISFTTKEGNNLLQVTSTRRDENLFLTDEGRDLLLYLPKINEQQFSKKITNLHVLSEDTVGIFTQDEIWYIQTLLNDFGSVSALTKPVKSKIPVGCRDGSDIITALDGKFIVFSTQRGITALSPQDFVATTEQTLKYLSDNIQNKYSSFYNDAVHSTMFMPNEFTENFPPMIKITTYKYWILFYRYMDREILALDTRSGSWWVWTTAYPIKSLHSNKHLYALMQVDYNPIENMVLQDLPRPTLLGVSFVFTDYDNDFDYKDDVIENTLNGKSEWIDGVIGRRVVSYAEPTIKWWIQSQRLHFGLTNNYKLIKALNINAKGDSIQTAKISTKVYRDVYHPEKSEVTEVKINDIRTFIKRMNLMHTIFFQYKLETDIGNEEQKQIKINSLAVKYELKERIR